MTNAEATITENAATVAEQGAHAAPEKASSKKGATQKKGAPKGQKAAKGLAEERSEGRQEGRKGRSLQGSPRAARREQGRKDPGNDRASQGSEPGRDYESNLLASPQRAGLPLDRRQEARTKDRVDQDRGGRLRIPGQEVGIPGRAATCEGGVFFCWLRQTPSHRQSSGRPRGRFFPKKR